MDTGEICWADGQFWICLNNIEILKDWQNFINEEVKGKLDIKKPFSKQRLDAILDVIKTVSCVSVVA